MNSADDFKHSGPLLGENRDIKEERKEDSDEFDALENWEALLADEKASSNGCLGCKTQVRCDNNCVSEVNAVLLSSYFPDNSKIMTFSKSLVLSFFISGRRWRHSVKHNNTRGANSL